MFLPYKVLQNGPSVITSTVLYIPLDSGPFFLFSQMYQPRFPLRFFACVEFSSDRLNVSIILPLGPMQTSPA